MQAYLHAEVKGAVTDATLRDFCEQSGPNLRWLADHGVPFEASFCPVKTSYPTDDYFLYYSGNESFPPYRDRARPAPRGHRARGTSLPGARAATGSGHGRRTDDIYGESVSRSRAVTGK